MPNRKTDLIQQLVSVPPLSSQHHTLVGQNSCFFNCVNTSLNECAVIEISSHLDKFLRGRLLPWHTPPWQKFGRANAFQNKQSNVFSARSVVHNNLSILSRPGKAFPRERKWLCEYHNAWPSLGTLKYSSFWRWNSFQGHVTRHLDVAITLMMTMSSLSKILQSKNFSWEKLLTKSWNLQKKDVMDNAHSFSRKGSGFRIINTFHCVPSYS